MNQSRDQDPTSWSASISRYQETAKWAVGALGALGGILIASLSIAGLGGVEGHDRIWAIAGFGLALLGVVLAIIGVIAVLAPTKPDFFEAIEDDSVTQKIGSSSAFLLGFDTTQELKDAYVECGKVRVDAYSAMMEAKSKGNFEDKEEYLAQAKRAEYLLKVVNPAVDFIKVYAFRTSVRNNFRWLTIPGLVIGILLAAIGITMFSVHTKVDTESDSNANQLIVGQVDTARLDLNDDGVKAIGHILGPDCGPNDISVLVLAVADDGWDVVLIPSQNCKGVQVGVPKTLGSVH